MVTHGVGQTEYGHIKGEHEREQAEHHGEHGDRV